MLPTGDSVGSQLPLEGATPCYQRYQGGHQSPFPSPARSSQRVTSSITTLSLVFVQRAENGHIRQH